jgi:hypothetical protein
VAAFTQGEIKQNKMKIIEANRMLELSTPTPDGDTEQRTNVVTAGLRQALNEHRIFETMETVANTDDEKPNIGFGFLKGKLVYWNGKKYCPLTLRQSVKLYADIRLTGTSGGDSANLVRWLGMVAAALPVDAQTARLNQN